MDAHATVVEIELTGAYRRTRAKSSLGNFPFRSVLPPQYKTFSRSAHEALTGLPTHLRTAPARRRVDGHLPDPDATLELERFLSCQHLDGATTYGNPEQSHPNPQLPGAIPNRKSTIISPIFHQNPPKTPPQVLHHTLCVKVKVSHRATNYQKKKNPSQVLNWFTCITCIARSPTQKTPKRISTQLSPPLNSLKDAHAPGKTLPLALPQSEIKTCHSTTHIPASS